MHSKSIYKKQVGVIIGYFSDRLLEFQDTHRSRRRRRVCKDLCGIQRC
jgi:hypothetical protein